MSAALIQMILALIQEVPALITTVKADIDAVVGNQMTPQQFESKWTDMNGLWSAAKAKWVAA